MVPATQAETRPRQRVAAVELSRLDRTQQAVAREAALRGLARWRAEQQWAGRVDCRLLAERRLCRRAE